MSAHDHVLSDLMATDSSGRPRAGQSDRPIALSVIVRIIQAADLLAVVGAAWLAYVLHPGVMVAGSRHITAVGAGVFISAVAFNVCRAHDPDHLLTCCRSIGRILVGWLFAIATLLLVAFALKVSGSYSRLWVFSWCVATPVLIFLERQLFLIWIRSVVERHRLAHRTVIVGAGEHGQRVAARMQASADVQVRFVGFIDDHLSGVPGTGCGDQVLGGVDRLLALVQQNRIDRVVIALPWTEEERIRQLVAPLATTPTPVVLAPDLAGLELAKRSFVRVGGLPMLQVLDRPISGLAQVAKELEDRLGAALLLLLTAPLLALIAVAVKLDSPGPVIFKQRRYGLNNELIEIYKFRTMQSRSSDRDFAVQVRASDPRITRVGRFLRAWSLDELPQLVNVLRGEMSLVGPRPHAILTSAAGRLLEEAVTNYSARHRVKPGVTGWAQVNGWRGPTDTLEKIIKRVEHDLYYIENWSIWFDLQILLRTVAAVLSRVNSY